MGFAEFVVVIATIMSLNPLAMDMMLPALPEIGSAFHIDVANRLQMVLSAFLIGFGVGQFVIGPLSDSFGRRPVILAALIVYTVASACAALATTAPNPSATAQLVSESSLAAKSTVDSSWVSTPIHQLMIASKCGRNSRSSGKTVETGTSRPALAAAVIASDARSQSASRRARCASLSRSRPIRWPQCVGRSSTVNPWSRA